MRRMRVEKTPDMFAEMPLHALRLVRDFPMEKCASRIFRGERGGCCGRRTGAVEVWRCDCKSTKTLKNGNGFFNSVSPQASLKGFLKRNLKTISYVGYQKINFYNQ